MSKTERAILLPGPDGGNPLGFLTAAGTLRALDVALPGRGWRLSWTAAEGGWRPRLHAAERPDPEEIVAALAAWLPTTSAAPAFSLGDDLRATPDEYRDYALRAVARAKPTDRVWADFAAAFACETAADDDSIAVTQFCNVRGGQLRFFVSLRNILTTVTERHIRFTLFGHWTYEDPLEKSTMRWDPLDDIRYALRWRNPSGDPERKRRGSMLGANALAIHALPLFPVVPTSRRSSTTGFQRIGKSTAAWTWPIWCQPTSCDVVRSLVALAEVQGSDQSRERLGQRGIVEVYRSRRITVAEYYRNFTPAEPV